MNPLQVRCKLVAIQLQFTYETFISIMLQIRYCFAIDLPVAKFSLQIRIFLVVKISKKSESYKLVRKPKSNKALGIPPLELLKHESLESQSLQNLEFL